MHNKCIISFWGNDTFCLVAVTNFAQMSLIEILFCYSYNNTSLSSIIILIYSLQTRRIDVILLYPLRLLTLRENMTRPQNPTDLASATDERFRGRTAAAAGTSAAGDAAADARTAAHGAGTAVVRARTASDATGTGTADDTTAAAAASGTTETAVKDRHRDAAV